VSASIIPLHIILPQILGLNGVWLSFPVADILSFVITMVFLLVELRKMNKTVPKHL